MAESGAENPTSFLTAKRLAEVLLDQTIVVEFWHFRLGKTKIEPDFQPFLHQSHAPTFEPASRPVKNPPLLPKSCL